MGKRGPTPKREWVHLLPATPVPRTPEQIAWIQEHDPAQLDETPEMWKNDLYTVTVYRRATDGSPFHLSIRRNDRKPVRDWRHFQRIKNDICGDEAEAIELFPAESRLVDTANQYHLWCFTERMPIGWDNGRVTCTDAEPMPGAVQRPVE